MQDRKSELFVILQEESAEVIQAVSKYTRFGPTNIVDLQTEIGDFLGVLKLLIVEGHVDGEAIEAAAESKVKKLSKYMKNKV